MQNKKKEGSKWDLVTFFPSNYEKMKKKMAIDRGDIFKKKGVKK
jgi:hypothetical protein